MGRGCRGVCRGAAAAAAGGDEGDGPVFDLKVLEIVVVATEIEVEVVLLEDFASSMRTPLSPWEPLKIG